MLLMPLLILASFSGSVRAVFAETAQTTVSIHINLHDITSMAKQLADHIGKDFSLLYDSHQK